VKIDAELLSDNALEVHASPTHDAVPFAIWDGLPHLYLGYWVEGSRKMSYKARFLPQERLGMDGWKRVE
jgi:hypothetical protein